MSGLGHLAALLYGQVMPPHPARWKVVSTMIHGFGLRRPHTIVAKRRGAWFRLDLQRYLDVQLYYGGYHDYAESRFLEANLTAGDVFIDVGANIGYYTLLAARMVSPSGSVHAFEIAGSDFAKLAVNVSLNHFGATIRLNRVAIMDTVGDVPITPTFDAGTTHLDLARSHDGDLVPARTLDEYTEQNGLARVDYVKCDIEGAELMMLKGAQGLLQRQRPTFLIEVNPHALARFDATAAAVFQEFAAQGYSGYCLQSTLGGLRLCRVGPAQMPRGSGFVNVVAIPNERLRGAPARLPLRLSPRL